MKKTVLTLFSLTLTICLNAQDWARLDMNKVSERNSKGNSDVNKEAEVNEHAMFVNEDHKVYVNKTEKVYIWISNSEDPGSKKQLLRTHSNAMDYFLFDSEGINTIRSPWAVDPETGKVLSPKRDVVFDVYADGLAPITRSIFSGAPKYFSEGKVYYGKGLKVDLRSRDGVSGVKNTKFSTDGQNFGDYKGSFEVTNENENSISYYSTDNVGNVEDPVTKNFIVDTSDPMTSYQVAGKNHGNVLAPSAKIKLEGIDDISQVQSIKYRIGSEGSFKTYTGAISLYGLPDGDLEVNYFAVDNVKNEEEVKSTNKKSGKNATGEVITAGLYLDKTAPEVALEIDGDMYKGQYTFVSERTKFELVAKDNKAGVKDIVYGVSEPTNTNSFDTPFLASAKPGLQYINYSAVDNVDNRTINASKAIYLDNKAPNTKISFIGDQVIERDSLFITSDTRIKLSTNEYESGIQKVEFQINGQETTKYADHFNLEKEGTHHIQYNATDNVNNIEDLKSYSVIVDNTPPSIRHTFSYPELGRQPIDGHEYVVLPDYVKIYLAAMDAGTGVKDITYQVNDGPIRRKTTIEYFKKGTYQIEVKAHDILGNESSETIRFIIN